MRFFIWTDNVLLISIHFKRYVLFDYYIQSFWNTVQYQLSIRHDISQRHLSLAFPATMCSQEKVQSWTNWYKQWKSDQRKFKWMQEKICQCKWIQLFKKSKVCISFLNKLFFFKLHRLTDILVLASDHLMFSRANSKNIWHEIFLTIVD